MGGLAKKGKKDVMGGVVMQADPAEVFKRFLKNQAARFGQERTTHYDLVFSGKLRVTDVSFLLKVGSWLMNEEYLNLICLEQSSVDHALNIWEGETETTAYNKCGSVLYNKVLAAINDLTENKKEVNQGAYEDIGMRKEGNEY